jgi:hypothetical protein
MISNIFLIASFFISFIVSFIIIYILTPGAVFNTDMIDKTKPRPNIFLYTMISSFIISILTLASLYYVSHVSHHGSKVKANPITSCGDCEIVPKKGYGDNVETSIETSV